MNSRQRRKQHRQNLREARATIANLRAGGFYPNAELYARFLRLWENQTGVNAIVVEQIEANKAYLLPRPVPWDLAFSGPPQPSVYLPKNSTFRVTLRRLRGTLALQAWVSLDVCYSRDLSDLLQGWVALPPAECVGAIEIPVPSEAILTGWRKGLGSHDHTWNDFIRYVELRGSRLWSPRDCQALQQVIREAEAQRCSTH